MAKKSADDMTVAELERVLERKRKQQDDAKRKKDEKKIASLMAKREKLLSQVEEIEKQVQDITGKPVGGRPRQQGISKAIIEAIDKYKSTPKEILASLEKQGMDIKRLKRNIPAYLSNLKKQGIIESIGRGKYILASCAERYCASVANNSDNGKVKHAESEDIDNDDNENGEVINRKPSPQREKTQTVDTAKKDKDSE